MLQVFRLLPCLLTLYRFGLTRGFAAWHFAFEQVYRQSELSVVKI